MEEGRERIDEAVSISPYFLDVRTRPGNLLTQQSHVDQAAAVYREVIRRSPYAAEAYNNLGSVSLQVGKFSATKGPKSLKRPLAASGIIPPRTTIADSRF